MVNQMILFLPANLPPAESDRLCNSTLRRAQLHYKLIDVGDASYDAWAKIRSGNDLMETQSWWCIITTMLVCTSSGLAISTWPSSAATSALTAAEPAAQL